MQYSTFPIDTQIFDFEARLKVSNGPEGDMSVAFQPNNNKQYKHKNIHMEGEFCSNMEVDVKGSSGDRTVLTFFSRSSKNLVLRTVKNDMDLPCVQVGLIQKIFVSEADK